MTSRAPASRVPAPRSEPARVVSVRRRRFVRWGRAIAIAIVVVWLAARGFDLATRITPPPVAPPATEALDSSDGVLRVGPAYLARRGAVWVMQRSGAPVQLGYRAGRLTTPIMTEGDARMLALFETMVPSRAVRSLITTLVRARYRTLDRGLPETRRAEIFGESVGYADRFDFYLPTYHRLIFLHALYDIALALEHSPLLGCTAFAASGTATSGGATPGHTIVGRNFDFDADPWFDEDKLVDIVAADGRIPFVSVAWPGMTGAVTGMNAAGIWVSVNGGRAGELDTAGVPVVLTARAILEEARTLDDAIAIVRRDAPMASHLLLLADGNSGESAVVEVAPKRDIGVIRHPTVSVVANHFHTPALADDPKNVTIRDVTSTVAREARMTELLTQDDGRIDPAVATTILRDRSGVGGAALPLGNRNALNALIAPHSVVADLSARRLWISDGPHGLGTYRLIDLGARLERGADAHVVEEPGDLPEDPILRDGTYDRFRLGERLRREGAIEARNARLDAAADQYRRALALRADDHLAWRGLAEIEDRRSDTTAAQAAWRRVVDLVPESPAAARDARAHAGLAPAR